MTQRQCDHWTLPVKVRGLWGLNHRCRNPAKYRVVPNKRRADEPDRFSVSGEYPCGRHVRPYLMDNGDSVWQPWIVTRLVQEAVSRARDAD